MNVLPLDANAYHSQNRHFGSIQQNTEKFVPKSIKYMMHVTRINRLLHMHHLASMEKHIFIGSRITDLMIIISISEL